MKTQHTSLTHRSNCSILTGRMSPGNASPCSAWRGTARWRRGGEWHGSRHRASIACNVSHAPGPNATPSNSNDRIVPKTLATGNCCGSERRPSVIYLERRCHRLAGVVVMTSHSRRPYCLWMTWSSLCASASAIDRTMIQLAQEPVNSTQATRSDAAQLIGFICLNLWRQCASQHLDQSCN